MAQVTGERVSDVAVSEVIDGGDAGLACNQPWEGGEKLRGRQPNVRGGDQWIKVMDPKSRAASVPLKIWVRVSAEMTSTTGSNWGWANQARSNLPAFF